eukprot:TRINITY_DN2557_c0_g1_i2.p1 TRINITY_DN2557_c0_g1~~TRINITY_DN2557_c0_g1_i2.p1  ORF type:complete len:180 (+),score=41.33 TRINITY_DN2557_c0_g1_i2:61-540(+)
MCIRDRHGVIKYLGRLFHIAPVMFVSGKIICDYLLSPTYGSYSTGLSVFFALNGILLIISGFANIYILKAKEKLRNRFGVWVGLTHLKLLISLIFFTPIAKFVGSKLEAESTVLAIQFYIIVVFFIISPFLRFYRERYSVNLPARNLQKTLVTNIEKRQ